ncbi:MAG: uroporphyrinogen-III C-methyltransferase [Candidatus Adiutrix sp.]|jgi:uroporphyrinogen III methyltransferase/synthase|nr:uroporphyrinogen-III C-methyltransferase [Candidatus Adiutrix sp.]
MSGNGIVYLVGAGPGAPGLMTLRGAELMRRAEVLVYDYLAAPEIMDLAPENCRRIYVGKRAGHHARSQEEINRLLVGEARSGRVVVRLKGGDPYVFGRGGEEAQELYKAGVVFEVVPGVSSAVAAAAYAGIPLTHRDYSSQAVLVTGQERPDKEESAHDWAALAKMGTIAMVMGVKNLGRICRSLASAGRPADSPAALIQWGTTGRQKTVVGCLADLPQKAEAARIGPPALFVAGEVVALREQLNWFERRPLFGRRILVTRSREQASRLSEALQELGAEVWERPTIAIEALDDPRYFKTALGRLADYHWLVLTSPNAVELFMKITWREGLDARSLAGLKIAVIGPGTAEALKAHGLRADLMPEKEYVGEALAAALAKTGLSGKKVLLPRALEGRDVLPKGLAEAGAEITDLALYKTVNPVWPEPLPGRPDLVTFTSSSTAAGLAGLIPPEERQNYPAASIGPITSETARSLGFPVAVEAESSTIDSLVMAVARRLHDRNCGPPAT